jgi:hypothetical protein
MRKIKFCFISLLVIIFISGCTDPVNKTIAEFKKTAYAKEEFECAGIKGQIQYKMAKHNQFGFKDSLGNEIVLLVSITKDIVSDRKLTMTQIYQVNQDTFLFKPYKYSIGDNGLSERLGLPLSKPNWSDEELNGYFKKDFCKDKIPTPAPTKGGQYFLDKFNEVWADFIKRDDLTIDTIELLISEKTGIEVYEDENSSSIGETLLCFKSSSYGIKVSYAPTGLGQVDNLKFSTDCKVR